jgi:circadian clock protein KaiC
MSAIAAETLPKAPSGIGGLDEITFGGLPRGRPTLVSGSAGCGKTLLGVQFLVRGILDHDEPGVFMSFEETAEEVAQNVRSLGWDLEALQAAGKLRVDHVPIDRSAIQETGAFGLDGLFVWLGAAIEEVGATRVVLDTLEVLFTALEDQASVRNELQRLFGWLKARGVTAVITAERGDGTLTRHGLEEYVSDCVILLDHRIADQVSTRRLRVVKYRGSRHSSDECPFLIDGTGITALPVTSMRLTHGASEERVSTGVPRLDAMLGDQGYFRGSSILVTGTPGSGKTTLASAFAAAGCARGERAIVLAFEESPQQLVRNMRSVGIDLDPHLSGGLLRIVATRPSAHGLEAHLAGMIAEVAAFDPQLVVVDPLSAFGAGDVEREAMVARLVDWLKHRGSTALLTSLVPHGTTVAGGTVSSQIDTWLSLTSLESNGERNRGIRVVKSRGMRHSNQVRELVLAEDGITLRDVYTGPAGVLMGTARQIRESEEAAAVRLRADATAAKRRQLERRREQVEAQIAALRAQLEAETEVLALALREAELQASDRLAARELMAAARGADHDDPASRAEDR